jgi:hypothetical protein
MPRAPEMQYEQKCRALNNPGGASGSSGVGDGPGPDSDQTAPLGWSFSEPAAELDAALSMV